MALMEGRRPPVLDMALVKPRLGAAGQGVASTGQDEQGSFGSALSGLLVELHRKIMEERSRFARQGCKTSSDQVHPECGAQHIDDAPGHSASLRSLEQIAPLKSALADLPSPKRRKDHSPRSEKPENSSRRCTIMIDPEAVHAISPLALGTAEEPPGDVHQDIMQSLQKRHRLSTPRESFMKEALPVPHSCRSPGQSIICTDRSLLRAGSPQQRWHRPGPLTEDTDRRHRPGPLMEEVQASLALLAPTVPMRREERSPSAPTSRRGTTLLEDSAEAVLVGLGVAGGNSGRRLTRSNTAGLVGELRAARASTISHISHAPLTSMSLRCRRQSSESFHHGSVENSISLPPPGFGAIGAGCSSLFSARSSRRPSLQSNGSADAAESEGYQVLPVWIAMRKTRNTAVSRTSRVMVRGDNSSLIAPSSGSQGVKSLFDRQIQQDHVNQNEKAHFLSPFMVPPGSARHILWDLLGLVLIGWDCYSIPMELLEPPQTVFSFSMAWLGRIYWTVYMLSSFFIGYLDEMGNVEMRPDQVTKRYMASWFGFDIFIVLIEWLEVAGQENGQLGQGWQSLRAIRMVRTMRLLRLVKARNMSKLISEQVRTEQATLLLHVVQAMALMVLVAHFIACMWYGLGAAGGENNWVDGYGIRDMNISMKYIWCLQWSLSLFAGTVLYLSERYTERLFTAAVFLFAFMFAASLVSSITTAMTRLQIISKKETSQFSQLRKFLADKHITRALSIRIQRNAQHLCRERKTNIPEAEVELLKVISEALLVELHFEVHSGYLLVHPFFMHLAVLHPAGIRRVCHTAISVSTLMAGDVLFNNQETPTKPRMFFVMQGELKYAQPGKADVTVSSGQWLSEATLWTAWTCLGSATAESDCQLMEVNAKEFEKIVNVFPMRQVARYAEGFVDDLNQSPYYDDEYPGLYPDGLCDIGPHQDFYDELMLHAFPPNEGMLQQESFCEEKLDDFRSPARRISERSQMSMSEQGLRGGMVGLSSGNVASMAGTHSRLKCLCWNQRTRRWFWPSFSSDAGLLGTRMPKRHSSDAGLGMFGWLLTQIGRRNGVFGVRNSSRVSHRQSKRSSNGRNSNSGTSSTDSVSDRFDGVRGLT